MKTRTLFQIALILVTTFVLTSSKIDRAANLETTMPNLFAEVTAEEELEVEAWMVNDFYWNQDKQLDNSERLTTINNELTVEKWMTDDNLWKI